MPLTTDHYRYSWSGTCNIVASGSGNIAAVDNQTCVVAANDLAYTWNVRKAEKMMALAGGGENSYVTCVKLSDDRRRLATGAHDGTIRLFDQFRSSNSATTRPSFAQTTAVDSSDEEGEEEQTISRSDERASLVLSGHKSAVNCLAFSTNGMTLASGGRDNAIIVWDLVNECGLYKLLGHKNNVTNVQLTKDGRFLLSSSKDTFIKFWSLETQSCFYTLTDHSSEVYSFLLYRDDTRLVCGSADMELRVYSIEWLAEGHDVVVDGEEETKEENNAWQQSNTILRCKPMGTLLRMAKGRCHQLVMDDMETMFIVVGVGALVDIFRVYSASETEQRVAKKVRKVLKQRTNESTNTSPPADEDGKVEALVRTDMSTEVHRMGQHKCEANVKSVSFAPSISRDADRRKLMVLLGDNRVTVCDVEVVKSAECVVHKLPSSIATLSHRTHVTCIAVSHDQFAFATGSSECVKIWNRHSMSCVRTLPCVDVTAVLFVAGDGHLVVATKAGALHVFDVGSGDLLESHDDAHDKPITSLAARPDNKGFASAAHDKTVKTWMYELTRAKGNRLTLKCDRRLELSDDAMCVRYGPQGKHILVGLLDNTCRVFFDDTFNFFLSLYGHSLPVLCVDVSFDDTLVVTGSADKNVKLWGLDFGDCHKSLFAHDDAVTAVQFVGKTHRFFTCGKDGRLKHWDGDKFTMIQTMRAHFDAIWTMGLTKNGHCVLTAGHDHAIKLWEKTEELLVVEEEEEMAREREHEEALVQQEDVVVGESRDANVQMAAKRTLHGIKSAEHILEAVDIWRQDKKDRAVDPNTPLHALVQAVRSANVDHFVVDIIGKVKSADLDKCLLMMPYGHALDVLRAVVACSTNNYRVEACNRVAVFLLSIHQQQLTATDDALPIVDRLRKVLPEKIQAYRDVIGYNMAALQLLQLEFEQRMDVQLFMEAGEVAKKRKKKQKRKEEQAYVMAVA